MPPAPPSPLDAARASKSRLRAAILEAFDLHARELPWRSSVDPYAVWVSEVMLQQTQVQRVIPFFERFLARFPTVEVLARAELGDVLAAWSGLGYYARARRLHQAARAVVEEHRGRLPDTVEALEALPGFGRYTAGAVASIAFGRAAPAVDGNVARVFARLFAIEGQPGDRAREALLWELAALLVSGPRPGDWNQALMELGATVCLPATPSCGRCPVAELCRAHGEDRVASLPSPRRPPPKKDLDLSVALAHRHGAVVLAQRPEVGLFGGLWELPSFPRVARAAVALRAALGPASEVSARLFALERTLTHRHLVLHVHQVSLPKHLGAPPAGYIAWRWFPLGELPRVGLSSAMEAALARALPPLATPQPSRATRRKRR